MEIRLSQAITANPIQFTANVEVPKQPTDAPQAASVMEPIPEPVMEAIPEPVVEEATIVEPEPEPEPVAVIEPEPVIEAPEPVVESSPAAEEAVTEPVAEEAVADTTNSDPNRQLSADEIAALFASANGGTGEAKSEPPAEAVTEPVPEVKEEPAKPPVVDLNNTNRNLTPDEIAALFSSM